MFDLIGEEIQSYGEKFTTPDDALRSELLKYTQANHPQQHMISGVAQGRFLELISKTLRPQYILEIGTFTGYSALCLAAGLVEQGELHTLELREADAQTAAAYFQRSAYAEQIKLHVGSAIDIIPTLPYTWDLVFIDADKTGYTDYYEMVVDRVRPGGLILADNVLFHGEVLRSPVSGKNAKAIQQFNERVAGDDRVETVLLTIRDGIMMIRRK